MVTTTELKPRETIKRGKLQKEKPYVYEKVSKFGEKIKRGESIAIIQFQYNYACNFMCVHCSVKRFQGRRDGRKFTIADVKELSRQADELGLARFVITGGEPLIFKDLDELVEAINPKKFYINCDTNGWFLDEQRAKHLKEIGIDRIQLSIDNSNAGEHDAFRRMAESHKRAMLAVDESLEAGLDIFIQTVVTKQRLYSSEFLEFVEYFNKRDIGVFVTYAKPVGAWEGNFDVLINMDDMDYFRELEKRYNLYTHITPAYGLHLGCPAGKNIFSITQMGDILPCPYFHCSMGNFFNEPLKVILDRCMRLKPFKKDTCLLAEDREFIDKYLVKKIYGKPLPVPYKEVFEESDFEG